MKLVKVKDSFYELCRNAGCDDELLFNKDGRPCVLIMQLKYKAKLQNFVVPLRSNITPTTPGIQYFSLPPNNKTLPHHKHGIHYIKLFPITNQYIDMYHIDQDKYLRMIMNIINKNEATIINNTKKYLIDYENGLGHGMTPKIDDIIALLNN